MVPSVVAEQLKETLIDYLRTTFSFADPQFEKAFFEFLAGPDGIFKGPYIDLRLPFRKTEHTTELPLEIRPARTPYEHQRKSFLRLHSSKGHQPQHTLVVTGTGSGKTECFLYPILDHCYRAREQRGIKAILLYPMNALATDQARRLAEILWNDERLKGHVTAGLYVGGEAQHRVADAEHLVDNREILRQSPPDILLTNYKMLDFLLQRPDDRNLWAHNTADTLRYLVLDELHTYDGAQGSDVACLIRRLKARLLVQPGGLCCVGTSATIGARERARSVESLLKFARQVFGEEGIYDDAVITESRFTVEEWLEEGGAESSLPGREDLDALRPEGYSGLSEYIAGISQIWLGSADLDAFDMAERLAGHSFLRWLLTMLDGRLRSQEEVCRRLAGVLDQDFRDLSIPERTLVLDSFLALVSFARVRDGNDVLPFLTCQVQVWIRELRRLLRAVGPELEFFWEDERRQEKGRHGLPIVYCRECGVSGVGTVEREGEQRFVATTATIGEAFLRQDKRARMILLNQSRPDGSFPYVLNTRTLKFRYAEDAGADEIPVAVSSEVVRRGSDESPKFQGQCIECGADGSLSILGSRAATLSSVAISLLFNSPYNTDKKMLAFTDSVQDASHRSGFFGARTYRFHLRTRLQKMLEEQPDDVPLPDCADKLLKGQNGDEGLVLAGFWPADLQDHPGFLDFREQGNPKKLWPALKSRLSWEISMEYGYSARVGRTLEKTGCSTVLLAPDALHKAAVALSQDIVEQKPVHLQDVDENRTQHFLSAFLHRLRVRGGIFHPLLDQFLDKDGNGYFLSKRKNPLISPFPVSTRLPRFLHNHSSHDVFDTYRGSTLNWYRDWASRALGVPVKDEGVGELYRLAIKRLEQSGLVRTVPSGKGYATGLCPEGLLATRRVGQVTCPQCGQRTTLACEEAQRWAGRRCPRFRCSGKLERSEIVPTYYGRIYRSGNTTRIVATEHTGLLSRPDRETVEERFKAGGAGDPNLLVCTPTLELGVDVGDLSVTMVCSVPPTTANYLQRMGRAGRRTGNAFCLSMALSRPHDLYFYTEPMEMMAGQVLPPGCFLDAPEMLKRQFVAFVLDGWAREEEVVTSIPRHAAQVMGAGREKFPGRAIAYFEQEREPLLAGFLKLFEGDLSDRSRLELSEFVAGDAVPKLLDGAFASLARRRDELKNQVQNLDKRHQQIEADPDSSEDAEVEKRELEDSKRVLRRLLKELRERYPLNVLTDEGVLPNYAFPEPGVTLRSVVKKKNDGPPEERYETREYVRAASTAIREFAPFNSFYAEGRRVEIRQIDIGSGKQSLLEKWRFCPDCHYMVSEAQKTDQSGCPRCGSQGFEDTGQVRTMVPFRRASAFANPLESLSVDETEERELKRYTTLNLIDVAPEHLRGARLIEALPFGYELLHGVTLREVNFGLHRPTGGHLKVAGQAIHEDGFVVCDECGKVQENEKIQHAGHCKYRRGTFRERSESILLYREVQSEAIRILLPMAAVSLEARRASFQAALQLGLRRRFQGNPGHLLIKSVSEPIGGEGSLRRHYLVLYDGVPGGTGYLSELWKEDHLLDVLQLALDTLLGCPCNRDENRDGCYRCLFAYQAQRDLPLLSRTLAAKELSDILKERHTLKEVATLSEVQLDERLDSELELRFLECLRKYCEEEEHCEWAESFFEGNKCHKVTLGSMVWRVENQVDLGPSDGVAKPTRPDFLLTNLSGAPTAPRVAVYCDGFAFHAQPEEPRARIADDVGKRSAIIDAPGFAVWSLTWFDLDRFGGKKQSASPTPFRGIKAQTIGTLLSKLKGELPRDLYQRNNLSTLIEFLRRPEPHQWSLLAGCLLAAPLGEGPFHAAEFYHDLQGKLLSRSTHFPVPPAAAQKTPTTVLGWYHSEPWLTLLASASTTDVKQGRFDKLRVTVRLFDEHTARQHENFVWSWQNMLSAWNLLQFHQRTEVLTSEMMEVTVEQVPLVAERAPVFDEELELVDESCHEMAALLLAGGVPRPEVGYELATNGRVQGQAELAWPMDRCAVVLTEADRNAFKAAGWSVFTPDQDIKLIEEALRG